ncbi:SDR family NAD(P)-dependent oxidoreductase [Streptomyces californicus]|uniref:SDR family NAD(P)-dependent oxidoreductase n=1 Tax=Streptomyces californicus TaxID=67351 RepID=UPI0037B2E764
MNESQERMLDRRLARDPIAIVGLSGLFPKSRNVREFWANVVAATDCTSDVPAGHWDVDQFYDPDPAAPDKTYAKRGGFIPEVPFNPLEFGLPPNTLEVTDVLQLLSLTVTRDLLRDAGADQGWYDPKRTGVVLGITGANQLTQPLTARLQSPVLKEVVRSCGLSERDAEEIDAKFRMAYAPWEENSFPGMLGNVVAGRIANRFDLGGINMTIDAACASSLGAVRTAVSELLEGRADTMLTGGCDAENTIFMYLCFSKTPALSKSGRIRPFDSEADGTLIGEGIGMLALRRLADAERDGNQVYAILRGLGTSSDGRFKSIYAPRKEGQIEALRRAYQDADASPDSVELFEAHGTGTAVGDATELSALTEVVAKDGGERGYAAIGSVKSQIGHTKAAAGAASMIKLALALHHKVLPPTINVETLNPAFGPDSPFHVNTRSRPWIRDPKRPQRRAALSSFGFGGTNFHAVLQEYGDGDDLAVRFPVARVHLWHAPGPDALVEALEANTPPAEGPVPATHARVAFAARDEAEADALRELAVGELRARTDRDAWSHPKGVHYRRSAGETARVAALFAGQGSQYVDPGLSAVLALPPLRSSFDRANRHFSEDTPLSRVAFPPPLVDDEGRAAQEVALRATAYAQPAIGALSAGHFRYLTELGFEAEGFLGHSFGELTALYAAGAYDEETLHRLARARGRAMSPAPGQTAEDPGAMAAVLAPEERVAELLAGHGGLRVCNRNAPDQIVVGGATDEVDRLVEAAGRAGVRARRLPVSAAFHTPFVAHAVDDFRAVVDTVDIGVPRGRVYANSPGAAYGTDVAENRRLLAEQLVNPVEFATRVDEMYADGYRVFVEFGTNSVLTGLVGRILGDRPHTAIALDGGPGKDADLTLKQAVARLVVLGLPITAADRYHAPAETPAPAKGMSLMLNGINYVAPERRAAYRDALSNGYRVPAAVPAAPAPAAVPAAVPTVPAATAPPVAPAAPPAALPAPARARDEPTGAAERPRHEALRAGPPVTGAAEGDARLPLDTPTPAQENEHMPSDRFTELLSDHLSLHDEYLNGQLQSVERLTRILGRAVEEGRLEQTLPGVSAVKEHGLSIGRTHAHANDVLRQLAQLEMGGAPAPAPTRSAPVAPAPVARPAVQAPALPDPPVAPALPPGWVPTVPAEPSAPVVAPAPAPAPADVSASVPVGVAGGVDAETVRSVLLGVVAEKTGYPAEMLELDMGVESDLGIDSIKRVEIMGVMQERFGVVSSAGPEQLAELRTLGDIVGFVAGAGAGVSAPASAGVSASASAGVSASVPVGVAGGVDAETVRSVLLGVVAEKTGYPAEMLELDMGVESDLGIDSIKRVEIMGVMQERFGVVSSAGPEQLAELRTLGDIVGFVAGAGAGVSAPASAGVSASVPADVSASVPVGVAGGVDAETVRSVLLGVVAEKTGYPAEMLELDMGVESDLGIDSIKRVEIMGVMQERFGVVSSAGPEQLAELRTLGDIVDFVAGPTGDTAPATTAPANAVPTAPQTSDPAPAIGRGHAALVTLPAADPLADAYAEGLGVLVVDDGSEPAARIAEGFAAAGRPVHVLRLPGVPERLTGVRDHALTGWGTTELEAGVEAAFTARIGLVVDVTARTDGEWSYGLRRLTHSLLLARYAVRPLTDAAAHGRAGFLAVTRLDGAFGLSGVGEDATPAGGVAGLVKTLALEAPGLFCRSVDLAPGIEPAAAAALVLAEAADSAVEPVQVGHDGTRRVGLTLADEPFGADGAAGADAAPLTSDDFLVVTGGGRGITADCVTELARRHRPRFLLLGRTPLDAEPAWAEGLPEEKLKGAAAAFLTAGGEKPTPRRVGQLASAVVGAREVRATLEALRSAGSTAEYLATDITDQAATAAALAPYKDRVTGVVHGAGVLADQMIAQKKASEIERVFAAKLTGLRSVMAALAGADLRHVVLFSSVAGFFGNQGQSDYAMANEALNAWASSRRRAFPATRVTSVNWGAWDSGMVSPEIRKVFRERGITLIPVADGARMFADQFEPARAGDVVTVLGPTTPLSSRDRSGTFAGGTVTRSLAGLAASPLVADHVIDAVPVLPAVVAMGWALGAVEHADGRRAVRLRDFAVHRGIVFDGTEPDACRLVMTPAGGGGDVKVAVQSSAGSTVRPHYAATVVVGGPAPAAPVTAGLPAPGTGADAAGLYTDGTLFHGPALRGLRRILADSESRLVLECEAGPADGDDGSSAWFAARSADLLLQAALVWVRKFRGTAGLPLGVGGVELYGPLNPGEVFLVVVEPAEGTGRGGPDSRLDVTACTPDGQVRARFTAVSVVSAPQLAAKFTG